MNSPPERSVAPARTMPAYLVYLAPVLFACLLMLPLAGQWMTHYPGDARTDMNIAYRHFLHFALGALASGDVPLWNPHIFCGAPFLPNTSATIWHPVNGIVLRVFPVPLAANLIVLLHLALFGAGTALYARTLRCSQEGALFAGLAAAGSSAIAARVFAGHFTMVSTISALPLLFAAQEHLLNRQRGTLLLAGAAALVLFGGHGQLAYYAALFCAIRLALVWLPGAPDRLRASEALTVLARHAGAAVLALALFAIEFLPLADTLLESARAETSAAWRRSYSLPVESLLQLIAPNAFGSQLDYFGRWFWWETTVFAGAIACFLAVAAVATQVSCRRTAVLAGSALLFACAGDIPGLHEASGYVPGWSWFRGHAKAGILALIFLAPLAGFGLDAVRQTPNPLMRRIAVGGGVVALLLVLLAVLAPSLAGNYLAWPGRIRDFGRSVPPNQFPDALQSLTASLRFSLITAAAFLGVAAALMALPAAARQRFGVLAMVILAAAEWSLFAAPPLSEKFPQTRGTLPEPIAVAFAAAQGRDRAEFPADALLNRGMTRGFDALGGNDIVILRGTNILLSALQDHSPSQPVMVYSVATESPLLDLTNLRLLGLPEQVSDEAAEVLVLREDFGRYRLYERPNALPRAYVAEQWHSAPPESDEATAKRLRQTAATLRTNPFVQAPGGGPVIEPRAGSRPVIHPAEVNYPHAERAEITAPAEGLLVLTDALSRRWRATRNGEPVNIFRVNAAFRGIPVAAGDQVVFAFDRTPFRVGAGISLLTLAGVLGTAAAFRFRRRRPADA